MTILYVCLGIVLLVVVSFLVGMFLGGFMRRGMGEDTVVVRGVRRDINEFVGVTRG